MPKRTAWSINLYILRIVEWPWIGWEIQTRNRKHYISRQYVKGRGHLTKWEIK